MHTGGLLSDQKQVYNNKLSFIPIHTQKGYIYIFVLSGHSASPLLVEAGSFEREGLSFSGPYDPVEIYWSLLKHRSVGRVTVMSETAKC